VTPEHCVSLLTDYGLEDGFVAACHGVIVGICPHARIIDITHLVPPGDVRRGAAIMAQTVPYLPAGVHVAVVDPGVGTRRRAVAVAAGDRVFVGPDNGVLSWAATGADLRAWELTESELWLEPVSATFHGRDLFAPVAARLAAGAPFGEGGDPFDPAELAVLELPSARLEDRVLIAHALTADRFGNVLLDASAEQLGRIAHLGDMVEVAGRRARYARTFAEVGDGELLVYEDARRNLAIAVNRGSAAEELGLAADAELRLRRVHA
jgi:S-adenosyl-L-methionine hydrolase (adenosine-forming)